MPLSPHLPSARGKAAAAPLRASDQPIKARRHLALIPHRAKQAVSFGYFSLGPQRKVTRALTGDRKRAAGEPSRGEAPQERQQRHIAPIPDRAEQAVFWLLFFGPAKKSGPRRQAIGSPPQASHVAGRPRKNDKQGNAQRASPQAPPLTSQRRGSWLPPARCLI